MIIVAFVSRIIVDSLTKYVTIDSKDLVDELNRLQEKIIKRRKFERQMRTHDKQRVFENSSIVIEFFFRASMITASIITALTISASIINDRSCFNLFENSSRISSHR